LDEDTSYTSQAFKNFFQQNNIKLHTTDYKHVKNNLASINRFIRTIGEMNGYNDGEYNI
jgi:arsenate reductase-like glutaredoxin family protein